MKFGSREICDVVFKATAPVKIGKTMFKKGQPVLYIDTAKTSTVEGAATTVYAQGGAGNARLLAWEGEKTLTFTVEDALLSPIGFAMLSGAGLFKDEKAEVHVHTTSVAYVDGDSIDLSSALGATEAIDATAPVFVAVVEEDGSITGELIEGLTVEGQKLTGATAYSGKKVFVDFYVVKKSSKVSELQIDAKHFGGYYYVEASTLFRRQSDGVDLPATLTFPKVKIQSNFTFSFAPTGDPSTFTFTMDAFPEYTMFNKKKKVLCAMQIVEDAENNDEALESVMEHAAGFNLGIEDSTAQGGETEEEVTTVDTKKVTDTVAALASLAVPGATAESTEDEKDSAVQAAADAKKTSPDVVITSTTSDHANYTFTVKAGKQSQTTEPIAVKFAEPAKAKG